VEAQGGEVTRAADGTILGISLARTWAKDPDLDRIVEIKNLKRLDLSFTYISDRGIERLQQLTHLEELVLDTCEFITDAATSYLRANKNLRKLVLRGTDVTDVSLPYIATRPLSGRSTSATPCSVMLVRKPARSHRARRGVASGRHAVIGTNLNFLKLLPKLRKLSFNGIQRRNAGACWTPTITDLDMETISQLSGLEELNLGIGLSLGRTGVPVGGGNCRVTGGIQLTDLALSKAGETQETAQARRQRRPDHAGRTLRSP
jgi:Leucine-rich repeat (LRR) protein